MSGLAGDEHPVKIEDDADDLEAIVGRAALKWNRRIVLVLEQHPHRFLELKRAVQGSTQRMLTRSLRSLQRDGVIERTEIEDRVLHVTYRLTDLGRATADLIRYNQAWIGRHLETIKLAQRRFDAEHAEDPDFWHWR